MCVLKNVGMDLCGEGCGRRNVADGVRAMMQETCMPGEGPVNQVSAQRPTTERSNPQEGSRESNHGKAKRLLFLVPCLSPTPDSQYCVSGESGGWEKVRETWWFSGRER